MSEIDWKNHFEQLQNRVTELEIQLMHFQRQNDQLSGEIYHHQQQLDQLHKKLTELEKQESEE